ARRPALFWELSNARDTNFASSAFAASIGSIGRRSGSHLTARRPRMKRPCQRRRTLLPLVLALPVACSEVAVTAVDVARVDIEPATPSVIAGQSITLRATLRDARGNPLSGREVEWFSTDPSVATVDGNGVVTGMAVGSALVRASAGGREGEVSVTVQPKPVAAVVVSPATVQLVVDETRSLAAQPRAEDGDVHPDRAVAC